MWFAVFYRPLMRLSGAEMAPCMRAAKHPGKNRRKP
jgi:hypothetical protein